MCSLLVIILSLSILSKNVFGGAPTIEEIHVPSDCTLIAKPTDHLLVAYNLTHANGSVAQSQPESGQPFHLVLGTNELSTQLKGMCENGTRKVVYDIGSDARFAPIVTQSFPDLDDELSLTVTVKKITDAGNYRIFDAFKQKNISQVLDLIDEHVGINSMDEYGQTPLMIAVSNQYLPVVASLLNTRMPKVDVNVAKPSGFSAIFYAVEHSTPAILQALLRRGADPNAIIQSGGSEGNTPLHFACMLEKVKHTGILLEYGALPNIPNAHGQYPLQLVPRDAVRSTKMMFKQMFEEVAQKMASSLSGGEL